MVDKKRGISKLQNYSNLLISDHISQHHQSYLFWIIGLFSGSLSFSSHNSSFHLFPPFSNFTVYLHNFYLSSHLPNLTYKLTPYFTSIEGTSYFGDLQLY